MTHARTIILVVDDEQAVEQFIEVGLNRRGYTTKSFTNPEEAYEYFVAHRESVCVVITDCTMPRLTGWDLARKIFHIDPGTRIVMITGLLEADVPEDLKHRLHKVVHKPFTKSEILEAVESARLCIVKDVSDV